MTDFDKKYDQLSAYFTPPPGWSTQTVSGGAFTNSNGTGTISTGTSNVWVSGSSIKGGSTVNATLGAYTKIIVSGGIAIDGASLAAVGAVGAGATIFNATALYNADVAALGAGVLSNAVVGSSGAVYAGAGSGATGNTGADSYVGSGSTLFGTVSNPIVGSAGYALVGGGEAGFTVKGYALTNSGGLISGGTFNPGSLYGVGSGGTASGGTVGGTQGVFRGGTSTNQLFTGKDAGQFVVSNGTSMSALAISGAMLYASGGTLQGAIVSGSTVLVGGGTYVSWLNKNYKPVESNYAAGSSLNNTVFSGSTEVVEKDGIASNSTVLSGGTGIVSSGGTDLNPYISGGTEIVSNGGTILGGSYTYNVVSTYVNGSSVSSGSTFFTYGTTIVTSSGSGSGALVNNGGAITISSGGYIRSGGAYNGGTIQLSSGALGSSLSAYGGGTAQIFSGGTGTTIVASNGGLVNVSSGGSAGNLIISGGGSANIPPGAIIFNGGTIMAPGSSLVLSSGATADYLVASRGTVSEASGATLGALYAANSSGTGLLTQSGLSVGTAIAGYDPNNSAASSGTIIISSGGAASSMGAFAGGTAILGSGGTASRFAISGGTATLLTGAQIASGAIAMVSSGYGQGGLLSVDSGNSLTSVNVGSGGTANLNSGANIGTLFLSSGNATIGSGALVSQMTVMSGASGLFMSGASVLHVDIGSGGWVSGARITNGNQMVIASSGSALNTIVTYDSSSGEPQNSAYTMISSGGYVSGATIAGATPASAGDTRTQGGLLSIESGATLLNTSMGYNGRIQIKGLHYSKDWTTIVSNGVVYVTEGGTSGSSAVTWKMSVDGGYQGAGITNSLDHDNGGGFVLMDDGEGNSVLVYNKCFLAGSMIRTPKGEKAVERLRKGELISVYVDGREETREITTLIQRRARVHVSQPEDLAGWSVLITKDAFAPGLPNRDLSVTPEHCFYFDGRFVPARMLINGASIRYDHDLSEYDYYHIKTEPHSVIWANDVLSESWLDTDAQDHFEPDGTNALRLVEEERLNWDQNAAAPLEVGQDFVKPLHDSFAKRADELGLAPPPSPAASPAKEGTTMDPAPYIQLETGEQVQPQRHEAGRYLFALPAQAKHVILHSRRFRPSEAVGPYLDDRRNLGMLVGQVALWTGGQESLITRHLTDPGLKGWDVIEAGPHRWTNGTAELPLHDDGPTTAMGRQLLSIEVQAGGPYRLEDSPGGKEG